MIDVSGDANAAGDEIIFCLTVGACVKALEKVQRESVCVCAPVSVQNNSNVCN